MLRFLIGIYILGILVVGAIFLIERPNTPIGDVVVAALIWPYGVYKLIDEKVDVTTKLLPLMVAVNAGWFRFGRR